MLINSSALLSIAILCNDIYIPFLPVNKPPSKRRPLPSLTTKMLHRYIRLAYKPPPSPIPWRIASYSHMYEVQNGPFPISILYLCKLTFATVNITLQLLYTNNCPRPIGGLIFKANSILFENKPSPQCGPHLVLSWGGGGGLILRMIWYYMKFYYYYILCTFHLYLHT